MIENAAHKEQNLKKSDNKYQKQNIIQPILNLLYMWINFITKIGSDIGRGASERGVQPHTH